VVRDQDIIFFVHTPGGLMVKITQENAPKELWDYFRNVQDTEAIISERAVAFLSRLTGCPCTIKRTIQVSCKASEPFRKEA